mgnify:FL=1
MSSKNINTNTAVAQIILSKDHEIRLKKKPKKKTNNKKKKALEEVKSALQQFDIAVNSAKSANVKIPEALGKLPSNINQINSVKELNALALDLQNRVAQINQLVAQSASQTRTSGLFREIGQIPQAGFFPVSRPEQQIQPQIIPNQQFPQQPIQPLTPSQPITPTEQEDSDAEKTLDELQKEILSKLSPEDKAKAETEFEKERVERQKEFDKERAGDIRIPKDPVDPVVDPVVDPNQPALPSTESTDIVELKGLENPLTNQKFDIKAPRGFGSIYNQYKMLIKNLLASIVKIDDKTLNLPKAKDRDIQNQQTVILSEYDTWLSGLNKTQLDFQNSNPQLQQIENDIIRDLQITPVQLLTEIAKAQKLNVEIVSGEASQREKEESKNLTDRAQKFLIFLKQNQGSVNGILKKASDKKLDFDTDAQLGVYNKYITDLNTFSASIETEFDSLDGTDKVGILSTYNKTQDGISQAIVEISDAKRNYEDNQTVLTIPPIDFNAPVEVGKIMPLPKPKTKLTPAQEKAKKLREALSKMSDPFTSIEPPEANLPTDPLDKKNVDILIDYYKNPSVNFATKQKNSYLELFGQDKLSKIQLKKGRARKLPVIKREIQSKFTKVPDSEFMTIASQ